MWRIGSFPQHLAWIHAAVSEKPELTVGQRMDACAMTVALLTKSSRAKNPPQIMQMTIRKHSRQKLHKLNHNIIQLNIQFMYIPYSKHIQSNFSTTCSMTMSDCMHIYVFNAKIYLGNTYTCK